ncbi:hydrogen peroxide-inducible genes activator [Glacieibacterium frigidum]|uniref:LysR family transcriptional regulator n=1 Tax=Glacieibacterium frigidum TaxID=2593303 RepID=A0A552UF32_9SPHN|nr:hydrogen peroxide-inducible genes activator [Glacieibacterium frigidum]TRW16838.1 LysR family transcriptional regulator [Glacieibacterium frigidum]
MTPLPSLRQLRYLAALHDLGHFGQAAAACFVSQSTLSAGIAELERVLGVTLVERNRRTVRFTAIGTEIARRGGQLVRDGEALVEAARAAGRPLVGEVRLAVIPTVAPFVLPRLVPRLHADWPELVVRLREAQTPVALGALHHGDVDCVLLALPFDCGEVEEAAIVTEPLLLGVPAAEAGDFTAPVAADAIDPARLLLLEDGHCLRDHALAACNLSRAPAGGAMTGTSLHTIVQMVGAGLGTTLLPQMAIDAGIAAGADIAVRALAGGVAYRRIALVWRKGSARAADFGLLAGTIRSVVSGASGSAAARRAARSAT